MEYLYDAICYTDAVYGLCIPCHRVEADTLAGTGNLRRCSTCHRGDEFIGGVNGVIVPILSAEEIKKKE